MTTPSGPEPTTGRTLEPSKMGLKQMKPDRVYPNGAPDNYGQVNIADRDKSRAGEYPAETDAAHYRSDVDSSKGAQHHTLGNNRNQAAQGNHQHDGQTGVKMGPLEMNPLYNPALPISPTNLKVRPVLTVAATAADIRTFLHNFFEFRDV